MNRTRHWRARWAIGATAWVLALSCQGVTIAEPPETAGVVVPSLAMMHGHARPYRVVDLKPSIKGTLKTIEVSEGDDVEPGQILATLDDRLAQAAVQVAQAQADQTARIHHAQHALKLAENLVARLTIVGEARVASEFELDKARASRDQAQETLAEAVENQLLAKRKLELEQVRLDNHYVRAPFRAKVLKIDGVPGEMLDGAEALLVLVQLDNLKAELHLPIDWFGKMQVGEQYGMQASKPVDRTLSGRLLFAAPVIDAGTRTFRCVFEIPNADSRLPAGFVVKLHSPTPLDANRREVTDSKHSAAVKQVSVNRTRPE